MSVHSCNFHSQQAILNVIFESQDLGRHTLHDLDPARQQLLAGDVGRSILVEIDKADPSAKCWNALHEHPAVLKLSAKIGKSKV